MVEAALKLASLGYSVFPCGPDKAPRVGGGFKAATTDSSIIEMWGRDGLWRDAFIGHPPKCGVIIIDVDPRNGGENTLGLFPALPPTRTTRTRSGGSHYWLASPLGLKLRGVLGPGVDVKRAEKGYVIIPPSPGYVYVRGGELAEAPEWLLAELTVAEFEPDAAAAPKYFPFQQGTPYGEAALRNTLARLAQAENGARNDELNKAAFILAQLEAGGELSRDAALESLLRASEEIGLSEFEARNTIESGWKAGMRLPKQAPGREKDYE